MTDIIDTLSGMDDAALAAKFGFDKKLDKAKADIAELSKLSGDARTAAAKRVDNVLNPTVYADELGWIASDAKRKAVCNQTAAEAMCDCSPSSMIDD